MQIKTCTFIPASIIKASLDAPLLAGKYEPEPLKSAAKEADIPMRILVDNGVSRADGAVEVHRHEDDLWVAIEGEAHFEVGGSIEGAWIKHKPDGNTNDCEIKGTGIQGGMQYVLHPGDILCIPAGQPHMHWSGENAVARLWIIKIPVLEKIPFESIPGLTEKPPIK